MAKVFSRIMRMTKGKAPAGIYIYRFSGSVILAIAERCHKNQQK